MKLENSVDILNNELSNIKENIDLRDTIEIDSLKKELDKEENNIVIDKTVNDITKKLEENIEKEIDKLNLDESIWKKISKSKVADVAKVAIEAVLKGVLKKKFNINFSTFDDMKKSLNSIMNGDLKDALKQSSDSAIGSIKELDGVTKTTIKTIKNSVIDKMIDNGKYEIINKQTKVLNRISKNCEKFNEAMKINDEKTIRLKANAIKKDMKEIIPIKETILKAQGVLDKYSLWQNKGKQALSNEENEIIDKLNNCA